MSFFKWFKSDKKSSTLPVTQDDKAWVEENFLWLFRSWGYPHIGAPQYLFNEEFFPESHQLDLPNAESLKVDICHLLGLRPDRVLIEFREDIRDLHQMPYEFESEPFEWAVDLQSDLKQITLASYLNKHKARLLHCMVLALVKVRLYEDQLNYNTGEDDDHFVFLAAIYQGFGAMLMTNLVRHGKSDDGFWEETWNFTSIVPDEVMAFALALYLDIVVQRSPDWMQQLSQKHQKLLQSSLCYLAANPNQLFDAAEAEAVKLFEEGYEEGQQNNFEEGISISRRALFLTKDAMLLSDLYNNIGYYQQRQGFYEMSIESFHSAMDHDDSNVYAFSNLGFSLIMSGKLEKAEPFVRELLNLHEDLGYAHRNLAVYHWKKGNAELAEEHFKSGLEQGSKTDLLELLYAQFLLEKDKATEAKTQLAKAIEKGEPEALSWSIDTG